MSKIKTKKTGRWKRRLKWAVPIGILLIVAMTMAANYIVEYTTDSLVYKDPVSIPYNKVGLLLGTSKTLRSGNPNQYFRNRIQATVALFKARKIDAIVISGDNSREGYNEPEDMKTELLKEGIPENKIYLDYAGFRTLDSVVRMEKIFGQSSFTIISQEFHNRRAIYIAQARDLQVVGFNAEDVNATVVLKHSFVKNLQELNYSWTYIQIRVLNIWEKKLLLNNICIYFFIYGLMREWFT